VSDRKQQVRKALGIVGAFFFGSDKERKEQLEEIGDAVEEKVEEHRARRRIGPGAVIDTKGERVK
jgi:hypothetical protein